MLIYADVFLNKINTIYSIDKNIGILIHYLVVKMTNEFSDSMSAIIATMVVGGSEGVNR